MYKFAGLKAKQYSVVCYDKKEVKKSKGISYSAIKNSLSFDIYEKVLFNCEKKYVSFSQIKSKLHKVYTLKVTKLGCTSFDDKRFYKSNTQSLSYGHYSLRK